MADMFSREAAKALLANKTIYFIGDSNIRAAYKDMLQLLVNHCLMGQEALKSKMEVSCNGDQLVLHGEKTNGRNYREERLFRDGGISVLFYFITRCYSEYVESILRHMEAVPPDVVIFNSCLWDISRWGPKGVECYKGEVPVLLKRLQQVLKPTCLFIWTTTLPVSQKIKGGFLVKEVDFLRHTLRFDVLEANVFACDVVSEHGFDVLDLHYYFQWQIHRRAQDGVHWLPDIVRHISNLILTHVCLAWGRPLPNNFTSRALLRVIQMDNESPGPESRVEETEDEFRHIRDKPARKRACIKNDHSGFHDNPQNYFQPSFTMDFNFGGNMPSLNIGLNAIAGYVDFACNNVCPSSPQLRPRVPLQVTSPVNPRMPPVGLQRASPFQQLPLNPFSVYPPRPYNCQQHYDPGPLPVFYPNSPQQSYDYGHNQNFNHNFFPNVLNFRNSVRPGPTNPFSTQAGMWNSMQNNYRL